MATNEAVLGLGPLGSWKLGIEGKWLGRGDGRTSRVVFDQVQVKPVGILGLPLPDWMPQVREGTRCVELARGGASLRFLLELPVGISVSEHASIDSFVDINASHNCSMSDYLRMGGNLQRTLWF